MGRRSDHKREDLRVLALADPPGAALYHYYKFGELKAEGSSITEGIGQGRITANLEGLEIDQPYQIRDEELVPMVFDLLEHEGLFLGSSSGITNTRSASCATTARSWLIKI